MVSGIHLITVKISEDFNYEAYLHLFDPDITDLIESYRFQRDRVVAFTSALLKHYYLASFLGVLPENVFVKCDQFNRPHLLLKKCSYDKSIASIDFNISHSGDCVVLAVASDAKIGIDVECISSAKVDLSSALGMSQIIFSASEQQLVNNDLKNFFLLWTKKEALLKAVGVGFADELYSTTNLSLGLCQEMIFHGVRYTSTSRFYKENNSEYCLSVVVQK